MRSMEDPPHGKTREERQALAARVGAYLTDRAHEAGFDVRQRAGGRAQLAGLLSVSLTTVSRTLDGKTLPLPSQLTAWASVLGIDHGELLVESGLIPPKRPPGDAKEEVPSATLTPDVAMDAWGITDPKIRKMLTGNIEQARSLQQEIDAADRGATASRG
ncbi:transcriptional regulator [Streptomyces cylindrosporus]|uniref:Transcriptional regulator n=1 Tax=Streptomyces cylindrosporus TaxID=2927583 RepID=A0ABS9YJX1_9ACTN|nr:transcriptional regulator [Streptomyces cylindrosporus]MCI3277558.1 transcriptional regulator [Streptomyces cylindrosporus]